MTEESMQIGRLLTSLTALIVATSSAGSSIAGMPALTSSMCAPALAWAIASARTRSMRPSFISAASTLRPVGLMRSPMITKGRSIETTTSRLRELRTVSKAPLSLAQGLVALHDGLLARLGAFRGLASIADDLLGHPRGHRCIGSVAVRTNMLGVFLGHRRSADRDVHIVSKPRFGNGFDVDLEHRHRRGQECGEADDVRLVLFDGGDELLGRRVDAEVEHLEARALEHDHAQVLADVVDVALDGADDVAAYRLGAGLRDQRPQDHQGALHGAGGDEHLGDEEVALLEAPADFFEGRDEGLEQDVHRVHAELQPLLGESLHLGSVSVQRVVEQSGSDLFFLAHRASFLLRIAQLMLRVQQEYPYRIMLRSEQRPPRSGGDPVGGSSGRDPGPARPRRPAGKRRIPRA